MPTKHDDKNMPPDELEEGFVYRPYFTDRNGVRRYARHYGKKAWKIPVKKPKSSE